MMKQFDCVARQYMVLVIVAASFFAFDSCEESLPPRNDPPKVLAVSLSAYYAYGYNTNELRLTVDVVNIYDETLADTAAITGAVEIVWTRLPQYRKTFVLSPKSMVYYHGFNPSTGELAFDPGDTLRFNYAWDFTTDDSVSILDDFQYNPSCPGRRIANSEILLLQSSVRIFSKVATIYSVPQLFKLCYIEGYAFGCSVPDCN